MTELAHPEARSALASVRHVGRHGRTGGEAGVRVRERVNFAVASIAARKGQAAALAAKIKSRTGLELPASPRIVTADHLSFAWSGPQQWLAMADGEDGAAFAADLARDLAGLASVTDQTDGRVVLQLSGPRVRDTLAKGCMLDLHEKVFSVGDTAVVPIATLSGQVTRTGTDSFEIAVMRSFALNLWHWLESSAAEYGLDVA